MNMLKHKRMKREMEEDDRLYIYIRNGKPYYTPSDAIAFKRKDEETDVLVAEKE